jgi:hypothetical protein
LVCSQSYDVSLNVQAMTQYYLAIVTVLEPVINSVTLLFLLSLENEYTCRHRRKLSPFRWSILFLQISLE